VAVENQVFLSQHIGDLETTVAYGAFEQVLADFADLYELRPSVMACDQHPNYFSTQYAEKQEHCEVMKVQHHYAHALSCMAENHIDAPALAVTWDGSGYGPDETVWGGEFLRVASDGFERFAHLRTFGLPGGEKAVKEPRRVALSILREVFGAELPGCEQVPTLREFSVEERRVLDSMLHKGLRCPRTSSAGRVFDAVASIINLRQSCRFEGQAAMELEFLAHGIVDSSSYEFDAVGSSPLVLDWAPMIRGVLSDLAGHVSTSIIAARFHNTLVEMIVRVAQKCGEQKVILSGGCFQNRRLTECAVLRLRTAGFRPYWHQRVPPNDGGIALGQIVAVARQTGKLRQNERQTICA
jgi:hydrogenase maturation protein HypF